MSAPNCGRRHALSGILGIWNLDGRPVDQRILDRMSETVAHRGSDAAGRLVAAGVALACRHRWVTREEIGEVQPIVGRSGALLLMDGRLDNRDELRSFLDVADGASDATWVLAAYEVWGQRFAERLNGDFALAVFDPRGPRLLLVRDAMGARPLYYHEGPGFLVFASEIKALLAHPDVAARPDDRGVADLLLLGARPVDGHSITCFQDIISLSPSHILMRTPAATVRRCYWDFAVGRAVRRRSFGDYADELRQRFAVAVGRRIRSAYPVAVSVSGGLDSSSVFCQAALLQAVAPDRVPAVLGVSYTGREGGPTDERRYLEIVESTLGLSVQRVSLDAYNGVVDGADEQIRHVEFPLLDYLWGLTRGVQRMASDGGARVLLSGHWGDQMLFCSTYLADLFLRGRWVGLARHLREYRRWVGAGEARIRRRRAALDALRALVPSVLAGPLKRLRRMLTERPRRRWYADGFMQKALAAGDRLANFGGGFHSLQARHLYIEARSKYHGQCLEWNNKIGALHGLDLAFPFFDRDLVQFLIETPGEMHSHEGVPRALMREAMRGVLPDEIRARTWKADFSTIVNRGVERDLAVISNLLCHDSYGVRRGYFDQGRLDAETKAVAGRVQGDTCLDSWDLTDAFGLEVWLRVFFPEDGIDPAVVRAGGYPAQLSGGGT